MSVLWFCIIVLIFSVFLYSIFPNLLTRVFHSAGIFRGPNVQRVALTFDDGPDPEYTGQILDVLQAEGVRATFFVLARNASNQPELINRMLIEGHEVQIHGMTHLFVPLLPIRKAREQIFAAADLLQKVYGLRTFYYRPTWGLWNLASVVCARKTGHTVVTWSVMVGDWRVTPPGVLIRKIMQKLTPGAIIVLHDSDKSFGAETGAPKQVILALPGVIASIRDKGYKIGTLSELAGEGYAHA